MTRLVVFVVIAVPLLFTGCKTVEEDSGEIVSKIEDSIELPDEDKSKEELMLAEVKEEGTNVTDVADEHFLSYLKGQEKDVDGKRFWDAYRDLFWGSDSQIPERDLEKEYIEYGLVDMNNDGQNELIIRKDGYLILDVIEYKNGKIIYANANPSKGALYSLITVENMYLYGDSYYEGNEHYRVIKIDTDGNANQILYFSKVCEDDYGNKIQPEYYKSDIKDRGVCAPDGCEKISKDEYETLLKKYTQEKKEIKWEKVSDLTEEARKEIRDRSTRIYEKDLAEGNEEHIFFDFIQGRITDKKGEFFADVGSDNIDYSILDMDNDGLKEMLVRWDGCWIPGVYRIHDGEVLFSQIASKDTDTVTYISVNEHDERFFVVGEKTDSYEKLWIYDVKKNYAPGLLAYYEKCRASNDSTSPMDYYIMDVPVRRNIDHKYCRKYCEEDFYIDFKLNVGEEDSTIEWRKTNGIMSENEESKKSSESIDMENVIKSYEDYIKLNYNSAYGNVNISLLFIDDNDIPEAIIEQDGDIEWSIIGYDSENEKAVYLAGCTMNSLFYKPKGGCFYYDWSDGESNGSVYYKINGSNISECSEDELGNDVLKNCIYYDGLFFSNPAEAFKNLK